MKYGRITIKGETFQQINKTKAEKLFNEGEKIFLLPCNANPYSGWIDLCPVKREDTNCFVSMVNAYKFHNCTGVLGSYVVYFKKVN